MENNRSLSYEEAITRTGYGCFHYKLLLLCGWAVSADPVEILGISFILPPATEELDLSDADKGWINSSVFLGEAWKFTIEYNTVQYNTIQYNTKHCNEI